MYEPQEAMKVLWAFDTCGRKDQSFSEKDCAWCPYHLEENCRTKMYDDVDYYLTKLVPDFLY